MVECTREILQPVRMGLPLSHKSVLYYSLTGLHGLSNNVANVDIVTKNTLLAADHHGLTLLVELQIRVLAGSMLR